MGHAMPCQTGKVFRPQPVLVSKLDAIRPAPGQSPQKPFEVGAEVAAIAVVRRPESGVFKHQNADLLPQDLAWLQVGRGKEISIEKVRIRLTGTRSETRVLRKILDRDKVRYF